MEIKAQAFKIKGMNKDASYSTFSSEHSLDNHNVRLTARNGNNLMSITNEKGNARLKFTDITPVKVITYTYASSFNNYINELRPTLYVYNSSFSNYINELIAEGTEVPGLPVNYTYSSAFTNYINELINS